MMYKSLKWVDENVTILSKVTVEVSKVRKIHIINLHENIFDFNKNVFEWKLKSYECDRRCVTIVHLLVFPC